MLTSPLHNLQWRCLKHPNIKDTSVIECTWKVGGQMLKYSLAVHHSHVHERQQFWFYLEVVTKKISEGLLPPKPFEYAAYEWYRSNSSMFA